jgi:hypothetical protein
MIEILKVIALMCHVSANGPMRAVVQEQCQWVLIKCVGTRKDFPEERLAGCIEDYAEFKAGK